MVLAALFWLQSRNTLPARRLRVIVAVTRSGMAFSNCWATCLATVDAPALLMRVGQSRIEMKPLAAAGERIQRQPDVGHDLPHSVGNLA